MSTMVMLGFGAVFSWTGAILLPLVSGRRSEKDASLRLREARPDGAGAEGLKSSIIQAGLDGLAGSSLLVAGLAFTLNAALLASLGAESRASVGQIGAILALALPSLSLAASFLYGISAFDSLMRHGLIPRGRGVWRKLFSLKGLALQKEACMRKGRLCALAFLPAAGLREEELVLPAVCASLPDPSPEAQAVLALAERRFGAIDPSLCLDGGRFAAGEGAAGLRGLDYVDGSDSLRIGKPEDIEAWVRSRGGELPRSVLASIKAAGDKGARPLLVAQGKRVLGVIPLKEELKPGFRERVLRLRRLGVESLLFLEDNPITAEAIAREAGVTDFEAAADRGRMEARLKAEAGKGRLMAAYDSEGRSVQGAALLLGPIGSEGREAAPFDIGVLGDSPSRLLDAVEEGIRLKSVRRDVMGFTLAFELCYLGMLALGLAELGGFLPVSIDALPALLRFGSLDELFRLAAIGRIAATVGALPLVAASLRSRLLFSDASRGLSALWILAGMGLAFILPAIVQIGAGA